MAQESREIPGIPGRTMGIGILASLIAGVVAGIGARIIMRIIALVAHIPTSFSIEGTLNIVFTGIGVGLFAGFIITIINGLLSISPKVSKYLPGPVWRGLIWGLLLLLTMFPLFLGANSSDLALVPGILLLVESMFGGLFVLYGLTMGIAEKALDSVLPGKSPSPKTDKPAPL